MKINWKIKKRRGNFRPVLTYTLILESFEKALAIQAVAVKSLIPEIPRRHESFCLPDENERHPCWSPSPDRCHWLQVPYFKTGETRGFIRLPFTETGKYPEVEASFRKLQKAYEEKICIAYGQAPFETAGDLDISPEIQEQISPRVTADRLLAIFN